MKPFDLERALAGDPVVTRSGKKVIALYLIKEFSDIKDKMDLLSIAEGTDKRVNWGWLYRNGFQDKEGNYESDFDLFMAPKIKTYYFNVYKNKISKDDVDVHCAYQTEEEAVRNRLESHNFLKLVSFELEV